MISAIFTGLNNLTFNTASCDYGLVIIMVFDYIMSKGTVVLASDEGGCQWSISIDVVQSLRPYLVIGV